VGPDQTVTPPDTPTRWGHPKPSRWGQLRLSERNAAADAFFSTLEWEVLSWHEFTDPHHAQAVVADWCYGFYNTKRRHSSAAIMSPVAFETTTPALRPEAA